MELKEFMKELKDSKNKHINIYFLSSQKEKKGILKNITGDIESESDKFIDISIKEIKSDDEMLKAYKCGGPGKKNGSNNKDRLVISLKNLEDTMTVQKSKKLKSDLYKLVIDEEEIGIMVSDSL
jgi:hypothetical protein